MTMSVAERHSGSGGKEEESEDESEMLEESPCGRWQKRKEQVNQGNVPGMESAFLAMDTEEGVEVVWNEVQFSDKMIFKAHEEKIKDMFENLMQVEHPNIVKFHKYWLDVMESKARVIFITEYMSSGSLKQFLKKTKKNHKTMNKKFMLLNCLSCLSLSPSKLVSTGIHAVWHRLFVNVFPDAVHGGIKHLRDEQRNLHFLAPEYGSFEDKTAIDIFSFGICALEMAVLEIQANGDAIVSKEAVAHTGQSLEDLLMRVNMLPENCVEEKTKTFDPSAVMAEIRHKNRPGVQLKYSHVSPLELDKFLEDVK
ncbi:UNVERIFIED_CONTAM: hypothetical protein FKN15_026579 [Acipenser sinensis]